MWRQCVERLDLRVALFMVSVLAVGLYLANGWLGLLNQDEGWYLYAALSHHRGLMPYRDFFFTQGPVLPAVYGWLSPLWAAAGVAGGRALTACLGLMGGVAAAVLAARVAGHGRRLAAAVLVLSLTVANVYHSYFTTIPKTYALACLSLMTGYLALAASAQPGRRWLAAVSGVLLAAAAGTRLSLGAALAVTGFWLLAQRRSLGFAWFWFGLGGAAGLALIDGPSLLTAREAFVFANTFHVGRETGGMLFVAGSVSRIVRGYLPLALFGVALLAWQVWAPRRRAERRSGSRWTMLWLLSFAAVFSVQVLSPHPYDDYQVPIMPLLAAAVAVSAVGLVEESLLCPLAWVAVAAAAFAAFSSPMNQDWFVLRQDRFWVVKRAAPDLATLRQVGRWLRENSPADKPLLTQDAYLAVEARRELPAGFEMGPFGYFPDLSDADAARFHVLNRAGMLRLLGQTDAPLAAFSGYGLAIAAPAMRPLQPSETAELWQVVANRYDCIETIPNFGQGSTKLEIWKKR